jgi:hypothetical protein
MHEISGSEERQRAHVGATETRPAHGRHIVNPRIQMNDINDRKPVLTWASLLPIPAASAAIAETSASAITTEPTRETAFRAAPDRIDAPLRLVIRNVPPLTAIESTVAFAPFAKPAPSPAPLAPPVNVK